jgi:hypothetical protein
MLPVSTPDPGAEFFLEVNAQYRQMVPPAGEAIDPAEIVRDHARNRDAPLAMGELMQFGFFVKHLADVRARRPEVFAGLKSRMYQCGQADNYFGLRMEARLASSFARASVPFELQERPDFSIEQGTLFAECGSVWPNTNRAERDYRARIEAKVREKSALRYATPTTILAMEITSVMAAMVSHGRVEDKSDLSAYLSDAMNATSFGALLLFHTVYSEESKGISSVYVRFDSPRIDPSLLAFMNSRYPRVGGELRRIFVPGQRKFPP